MIRSHVMPVVLSGARKGLRVEARPLFTDYEERIETRTTRTDAYGDRKVDSERSTRQRTRVRMVDRMVDTWLADATFSDGSVVQFDLRDNPPSEGERAHVVVHRIQGREFVELMIDAQGTWAVLASECHPAPNPRIAMAMGLVIGIFGLAYGLRELDAAVAGVASGMAIRMLPRLRAFATNRLLRAARRRTATRIRNAIAHGRTLATD
jgi:hypothetical protein